MLDVIFVINPLNAELMKRIFVVILTLASSGSFLSAQEAAPDYSKVKTLHMVATAHFDTQWRWTVQQSIDEFLKNTLQQNFVLFEKYPDYKFSFEGAIKYMWAKEYYPADYEKLKKYIASGQWNICGSSLDATDANIPSPESVIRTILIGQKFYQKEFGKKSYDIFLPDCFGFGYALPSIEAYCGLKGFSTQKLSWGSAYGVPFDIGVWQGVDGSKILAELKPGGYGNRISSDMSNNQEWLNVVNSIGEKSGLYVGYAYYGTGDQGGSPTDSGVLWLEKSLKGTGPLKVISAPADLLCRQVTKAQMEKLPLHNNELLATTHGTGCYTSQCAMKRWNRKNEQLGDAAERAAVVANWLGANPYPKEKLQKAWIQFLWHQFHDDITGTSIPEVYQFSWNDEIVSMNLFSSVLEDAVGGVSRALNTSAIGVPVVVYNPLSVEREDVAEATIEFKDKVSMVQVWNKNGNEVPSQVTSVFNNQVTILFLAKVPSVGFEVFDVRPVAKMPDRKTSLSITTSQIENEYYKVSIDKKGDISGIYDKKESKEMLSAPIRLAYLTDNSDIWPAWEITYNTVSKKPRSYVDNVINLDIVEQGTVRVTLRIIREMEGSVFTEYISLSAGEAGNRVDVTNHVSWNTKGTLVKAEFPLSVSNPVATYDLGMGAIERGNNKSNLYEVPAQQWADITNADGSYGITIMNDCKVGWDKPTDSTLRLTLLHTPASSSSWLQDNTTNDMGRHVFTYSISGHTKTWRNGSCWKAASLNQPLYAFQTTKHNGTLNKSFSFVKVNKNQVMVKALKMAEEGEDVVVRLQELNGERADKVTISFPGAVNAIKEVNGAEDIISDNIQNDSLIKCSLKPYQPASYAFTVNKTKNQIGNKKCLPISLINDLDGLSNDNNRKDGNIDGKGKSIPAELYPDNNFICDGITFRMGQKTDGMKNMMICKGNTIVLPPNKGKFNKIAIMAFGLKDTKGSFSIGAVLKELSIQSGTGFIGQWDSRILDKNAYVVNRINGENFSTNVQLVPGFIKRDPIAWFATHRHDGIANKNESYVFSYIYKYVLDLPKGAKSITLPKNENIIIAAMTLVQDNNSSTRLAKTVYDDFRGSIVSFRSNTNLPYFNINEKIELASSKSGDMIFYTLDGSYPSEKAMLYAQPILIDESTTIKAIAINKNGEKSDVFCSTYLKLNTLEMESVQPSGVKKGIKYAYYEGEWNNLPDFTALKPVKKGTLKKIEIPSRMIHKDHFGIVYMGYVNIPIDGLYTFAINSDDGSRLVIDDVEVAVNDGTHGGKEMSGKVGVKSGMHTFRLEYFNATKGNIMQVFIEGPGLPRRELINEDLAY
jgi:alpha-mannosidase